MIAGGPGGVHRAHIKKGEFPLNESVEISNMHFKVASTALLTAALVHGQTLYLAGDSTMAPGGGGAGTDGNFGRILHT